MLKEISILGFQLHRRRQFTLSQVTVFKGKSGTGKSSLLRALEWICTNQPSGDDFISWDKDICKVGMVVDEHRVIRKKGNGINSYRLNGEEYVSFGSSVPDDISKILKVDKRNFQNQHSSHYWLSLTSGQVAKELNEIIDLGIIDSTLSNIAKKLRTAKATKEVVESRLKEARKAKEEISWIVDAKQKYDNLIEESNRLARNRSRIDSLMTLMQEMSKLSKLKNDLLGSTARALGLCAIGDTIVQLQEKKEELKDLIGKIKTMQKKIEQKPKLDALHGMLSSLVNREEKILSLSNLIGEIKSKEYSLNGLRKMLSIKQTELEKDMDGKCPVCGNEILI